MLKAKDWLEINGTPDHEKSHDFINSLDDVARERFDDIIPADWNAMQAIFHRYFCLQGIYSKHLHLRLRHFKLDVNAVNKKPSSVTSDTLLVISVITIKQYCMPTNTYGTLYPVQVLDVGVAMIKDFYAKKHEPRAGTGTSHFHI